MLGNIAAVLTTASFVPDALKAVTRKDVSSVNLLMYSMFWLGVLLWFIYGVSTWQPSIFVANGVTLCFATITLSMKVRYDVLPRLRRKATLTN